MSEEHDELIAQMRKGVDQQISSPDTKYVARTLERLLKNPEIDDEEARMMIAYCLADEVEAMDKEDRPFNEGRYQLLLGLLPSLPSAE